MKRPADSIKIWLQNIGLNVRVTRRVYKGELLYTARCAAVYASPREIDKALRVQFGDRYVGMHSFTAKADVCFEVVFRLPEPSKQLSFDDYLKEGRND